MTRLSSASTLYKKQLEREKLSCWVLSQISGAALSFLPFSVWVCAGVAASFEKDVSWLSSTKERKPRTAVSLMWCGRFLWTVTRGRIIFFLLNERKRYTTWRGKRVLRVKLGCKWIFMSSDGYFSKIFSVVLCCSDLWL